jgi:hypothetical protein
MPCAAPHGDRKARALNMGHERGQPMSFSGDDILFALACMAIAVFVLVGF